MEYETKKVVVKPSLLTLGSRATGHDIAEAIAREGREGWILIYKSGEEGNTRFMGGVTLVFQRIKTTDY